VRLDHLLSKVSSSKGLRAGALLQTPEIAILRGEMASGSQVLTSYHSSEVKVPWAFSSVG
jgi:hypothetical protein